VACDIGADALGLYWADRSYLVPPVRADPQGFLAALREIVDREKVRVVFPTPDPELQFLPAHRDAFLAQRGCRIMVNAQREMERFGDKWLAHQWYLQQGLPAPRTARGDVPEEVEALLAGTPFPLVLKPRQGGGSRSLHLVRDAAELRKCLPVVPQPLLQERLVPDAEEYTAGTFRTGQGRVHVLVLRRQLKFGMTNKAEVVRDEGLEAFCRHVINRTGLEGANNIQFRRTAEGPKILEINPRFSGSTGIRAHFGFNEPEMAIRQFVLNEEPPPPAIRPGKVLRFMGDAYVEPEAARAFVDLRSPR
jgi:carbamoyl-phosphate synthase large subunit